MKNICKLHFVKGLVSSLYKGHSKLNYKKMTHLKNKQYSWTDISSKEYLDGKYENEKMANIIKQ